MAELLAPAGSIESLKLAVYSGADAVYLGLDNFNARIKASGFNKENIKEYTNFCHLYGVKVYVTLNTNIKNSELPLLSEYVIACNDANIDAFIVTDLGILTLLNEFAPKIPLHASTQLGTHNFFGAIALKKLGFSRVVVARETTLNDIKLIKEKTKLEIEYFVHGALCVSFSGNCLLSSFISGNSGNRGRCLQPCRLPYKSSLNNKTEYFLSPKDQCMIAELKELENAGVDSFKIEGRLKRPEYVAEVVTQYKKAMNNEEPNLNNLKLVYNRGNFTKGYIFSKNSNQIIYPKVQGHLGIGVGEVIDCKKLSQGYDVTIFSKHELSVGDGIKLICNEKEVGGGMITKKQKDNHYSLFSKTNIPKLTNARLTTSILRNNYLNSISKKIPIDFFVEFEENKNVKVKIKAKNKDYDFTSNVISNKAENCPITHENVKSAFEKLGNTEFVLQDIKTLFKGNIFLAKSQLNELRRECIEATKKALLNDYNLTKQQRNLSFYKYDFSNLDSKNLPFVEINSESQLSDYVCNNSNLVMNCSNFNNSIANIIINKAYSYNNKVNIGLVLPIIANNSDLNIIKELLSENKEKVSFLVVNNLYGLEFAKENNLKIILGWGMNIYNNNALKLLGENCNFIPSVELNLESIKSFSGQKNATLYAFGKAPLMTFSHCPIQVNCNCECNSCNYLKGFYYSDKQEDFFVKRHKISKCYFTLYNGLPNNLSKIVETLPYNLYLNMLEYNSDKIERILNAFINKKEYICENEKYTYGNLFRGAL